MPAILYIDLGSPFVYLAVERLERVGFGDAQLRPVSLGALFKRTGRSSWGMSPRREVGQAEVEARARSYGPAPVRWPDGWPSNYLHANRTAVASLMGAPETKDRLRAYTDAAYAADVFGVPTLALRRSRTGEREPAIRVAHVHLTSSGAVLGARAATNAGSCPVVRAPSGGQLQG